jgi:hypothetical protein
MKRTKLKETMDRMFISFIMETLDRKATQYDERGFQQQAKKIRNFKKEVRKFGGTL